MWPRRADAETVEAWLGDSALPGSAGQRAARQTADEFWTMVEERLAAGQMRLLFVADRIPLELRAIVEFLNRQMRHTDMYAVELTQYRGGETCVSSFRAFHGEVAMAAKSPSGRRTTQRSTRAEMDEAIRARLDPEVRRIAVALLDHAAAWGRPEGGTARYRSMSAYYPVSGRQVPVWSLSLQDGPVRDELSFAFGSIVHHLGRERAAAFAELLPAVPELVPRLGALPSKAYNAWPSVSMPALASEPGALRSFHLELAGRGAGVSP